MPTFRSGTSSLSPLGAIRHGLRATGARALERPRCQRGLGGGAGAGTGRSPHAIQLYEASLASSSAPAGQLLPQGGRISQVVPMKCQC
ncbi:hypothetical protein XarjCFBP7652_12180 [Xanthomonas arboricola]|nr:hypothetical protein XarbCFBP7629_16435 [Xanthomonas arboricola]PPT48138.1 hypothetical protein XarjCFBP7652_12180 [Xanthomonas arboricola]